jgi:cholesterol transport system auxiliary component
MVGAEPNAPSPPGSDGILVRSAGEPVAHVANAQWSDRLPRLLPSRLVEARASAGRARPSDAPFSVDGQVGTDLHALEISVISIPLAPVEMAAQVSAARGGKIWASRVFRASVPVRSSSRSDAVAAVDQPFHRVATALAQWAGHFVSQARSSGKPQTLLRGWVAMQKRRAHPLTPNGRRRDGARRRWFVMREQ